MRCGDRSCRKGSGDCAGESLRVRGVIILGQQGVTDGSEQGSAPQKRSGSCLDME